MRHYATPEGAAAYERKFRGSILRRIGHRREAALVSRMLARFGRIGRLLDCPCGAGRMLATNAHHAGSVVGADLWPTMLREALRHGFRLAAADIHRLPFRDDHFEVAVCHRLLHHIVDSDERVEILTELARVTSRGVVLSFWDAGTRRGQRIRSSRRIAIPAALELEALHLDVGAICVGPDVVDFGHADGAGFLQFRQSIGFRLEHGQCGRRTLLSEVWR